MAVINILEAKTHLSRFLAEIESGAAEEIIIARNGRPVARLVPMRPSRQGKRIGVAKGRFKAPAPDAEADAAAARLMRGEGA